MFDIEAYPDNTLYYRQCHHRIGHQCTPGEDRIGDDIYTLMSIYSGGQVAESVFVKTRWPADVPARLERSLETSDIIICPQSGQKFRRTSEKVHFFQVRELSLGKPYDVFEVMNETGGE